MQRFWNWCRHSATIVVARLQVLAGFAIVATGVLLDAASWVVDLASIAGVQAHLPTKWQGIVAVASGIIVELARRRTLARTAKA